MRNQSVVIANNTWLNNNDNNQHTYSQLETFYDSNHKANWAYAKPSPTPCFNPTIMKEIIHFQQTLKHKHLSGEQESDFFIWASNVEGIFSLGGDLNILEKYFSEGNRDKLREYAYLCIDGIYGNYSSLDIPTTSISLVQGDALGGGFESALSCNIVIAEKGVNMGLPEVLYNMIPGMGAYSLLSRKVGPKAAEKFITSGRLYSSEELFDMGIVDVLAEKGEGETATYEYIKKAKRSKNAHHALRKTVQAVNPITYDELKNVVDIWVDAAFNLSTRDIKMMQRIAKKQLNKSQETAA